jgi:hypothetical protein
MRRTLTTLLLAAFAAIALPTAADAKLNGRAFPFTVSVKGTIKESWNVDDDSITDGCGRATTGSGTATLSFATPKPVNLTLGVYTGFHTKPKVKVAVDRTGTVATTTTDLPCELPAPSAAACGRRDFDARVSLSAHGIFAPRLSRGDREAYEGGCPLPGDWQAPTGLGDYDRFETVDVLNEGGPKIRVPRLLFGGCDANGHCTHAKKRNVVHYAKHIEAPYGGQAGSNGTYSADVDWTITLVAHFPLHPRLTHSE